MQEINLIVFHFLNDLAHNTTIEFLVKVFVDWPIFILPLFLAWYWLYYSILEHKNKTNKDQEKVSIDNHKNNLLLIFYSTVVALIFSLTIQQFVHLDRPEEHLQAWAKLLLDHLPDASFPSDHATVSIAFLAAVFFAGYKKWWWVLLLPFVIMNVSRVVAWVHWPFDILAGSLVWIVGAHLVFSHIWELKFVKKLNLWIIKLLKCIKL